LFQWEMLRLLVAHPGPTFPGELTD